MPRAGEWRDDKSVAGAFTGLRSRDVPHPSSHLTGCPYLEAIAMFEIGRLYHRKNDIHAHFGGQEQGGIATPAAHPIVLLFTGGGGPGHGYHDRWEGETLIHYGEGQSGDMQWVRGNKAIRDHAAAGEELHLFRIADPHGEGMVEYLGRFECYSWAYEDAPDSDEQLRRAIAFHLARPGAPARDETATQEEPVPAAEPLDELRGRADASSARARAAQGQPDAAIRRQYRRSLAVREYVVTRAGGLCESCREPAPFPRPDGSPFLITHHVHELSGGGPDHRLWVGAICPNCHYEIHYGADGESVNGKLAAHIRATEVSGLGDRA